MSTATKTVWVRACDSFDTVEKSAEVLAKRLGHPSVREAIGEKLTCGCTKGFVYQVQVSVMLVKTGEKNVIVEKVELASTPPGVCDLFNQKIVNLELATRLHNCLERFHLIYLGSLVQLGETDFLRLPNFGRKSLDELKNVLAEKRLSLGMKIFDWKPADIMVSVNSRWVAVVNEPLTGDAVLGIYGARGSHCYQVKYGVPGRLGTLYNKLELTESIFPLSGMEFVVEGAVD